MKMRMWKMEQPSAAPFSDDYGYGKSYGGYGAAGIAMDAFDMLTAVF